MDPTILVSPQENREEIDAIRNFNNNSRLKENIK